MNDEDDEMIALQAIYSGSNEDLVLAQNAIEFTVFPRSEMASTLTLSLVNYPHSMPQLTFNLAPELSGLAVELEALLIAQWVPNEPILYEWTECFRFKLEERYLELVQDSVSFESTCSITESIPAPEPITEVIDPIPETIHQGIHQEIIEPETRQKELMEDGFRYVPGCPKITSSEPTTVKKSVFIAHVAPLNSILELPLIKQTLLSNKRVSRATHNISAYRIMSGSIIQQDCDDDGETAAGARLLELLRITNASNVLVVVSRWYGGVQLGPSRFKLINNVARDLLLFCKYIKR